MSRLLISVWSQFSHIRYTSFKNVLVICAVKHVVVRVNGERRILPDVPDETAFFQYGQLLLKIRKNVMTVLNC